MNRKKRAIAELFSQSFGWSYQVARKETAHISSIKFSIHGISVPLSSVFRIRWPDVVLDQMQFGAGVVALMIALLNRYNFWFINFKLFSGDSDIRINIKCCMQGCCHETKVLLIHCEIRFDWIRDAVSRHTGHIQLIGNKTRRSHNMWQQLQRKLEVIFPIMLHFACADWENLSTEITNASCPSHKPNIDKMKRQPW